MSLRFDISPECHAPTTIPAIQRTTAERYMMRKDWGREAINTGYVIYALCVESTDVSFVSPMTSLTSLAACERATMVKTPCPVRTKSTSDSGSSTSWRKTESL